MLTIDESGRWLLSAVFAFTGTWYLLVMYRALVRPAPGWRSAVGAGAHMLMSAAMIAMFWPWGAHIPSIAQMTVFTAAAAWFLSEVLLAGPRGGHSGAELLSARGPHADWYHAAMMTAMVWMAVAMATMQSPTSVLTTSTRTNGASAMFGMSMSSLRMPAMAANGSPAMSMGAPAAWVSVICLLLGAGFLAAAAWYALAAVRTLSAAANPLPAGRLMHDGIGALMALGTGVTLLKLA